MTKRDKSLEQFVSSETLREAAILRFASRLMGVMQELEAIDPPIARDEAEHLYLIVTAEAIVRRLRREWKRKLELVPKGDR